MSEFDLDAFLPYQLAVLSSRLSRGFAERYRERFGISTPEWRVVAHLSQAGEVSVREITQRVDMDKSKVSRAASRLEAAGYVTKRPATGDRRLIALALTESGRAMVEALTPEARAFEQRVLDALGPDAPRLRAALDTLLEATAPDAPARAPRT